MDQNIEQYYTREPWKIPNTSWSIVGYSRAGFRTGFYIHGLDMMIDAGPQKIGNPGTFLITHCHGDHIANIPFTLINGSPDRIIPNIFVHEDSKIHLENYIQSMFSANNNAKFEEPVANFITVSTDAPNNYETVINNNPLKIEFFECIHDIPTVGYGISTKKELLKEEFFNLKGSGKIIAELRKQGVKITETVYKKNIAFIWDTTIEVLVNNPSILTYPIVMIECTFFDPEDYEMSLSKKHIHWNSLKQYVVSNPDTLFILMHFSLRYTTEKISEFFENEYKAGIKNIKPWL